MKKCSSIFDTYILIENVLLIVSYGIYGIALLLENTFSLLKLLKKYFLLKLRVKDGTTLTAKSKIN